MTVRDIRLFGDPVLTTKAEKVTEFDKSLSVLIDDMMETMDAAEGVGLAANQVGVTRRVFVFDCTMDGGSRGHIVNPVWEPVGQDLQDGPEGCLSIPDIQEDVERFNRVRVTGQDRDGNPIEMEAEGLMARCIQHETDHLDGILFLRRLRPEARRRAMAEVRVAPWFTR